MCSLSRSLRHLTRYLSIRSDRGLQPSSAMIPREPAGMVSKFLFSSRLPMMCPFLFFSMQIPAILSEAGRSLRLVSVKAVSVIIYYTAGALDRRFFRIRMSGPVSLHSVKPLLIREKIRSE